MFSTIIRPSITSNRLTPRDHKTFVGVSVSFFSYSLPRAIGLACNSSSDEIGSPCRFALNGNIDER